MPRKPRAVAVAPEDINYAGLSEELQEWVKQGQVDLYPGREPGKPVVRWAAGNLRGGHPGALVPGSGRTPNAVDAANGRKGAIKHTEEYKALMRRILSSEDGGAFESVMQGMIEAATGARKIQKYNCEHCGEENRIETIIPPNPIAGKALIEFMVGRAAQYAEVDVNAKVLLQELSILTAINPKDFMVPGFTPEQIEERKRIVDTVIVKE